MRNQTQGKRGWRKQRTPTHPTNTKTAARSEAPQRHTHTQEQDTGVTIYYYFVGKETCFLWRLIITKEQPQKGAKEPKRAKEAPRPPTNTKTADRSVAPHTAHTHTQHKESDEGYY